MTEYETTDTDYESRDGGYFYGNRVKPKEFSLSCYFEDITTEMKEDMIRWLDRRTDGKLIFDRRPWCWYDVRPTKIAQFKEYTAADGNISGTFTVTFTAYDPFAVMEKLSLTNAAADRGEKAETAILYTSEMPAAPAVNESSFLLYNPGTEMADTVIRIAGDTGEEMKIKNITTGQECVLKNVTRAGTTAAGLWIEIDSKRGQTKLKGAAEDSLAYELHDGGYIQLAPAFPIYKAPAQDVGYTMSSSNITSASGFFRKDMIGMYVQLGTGNWKKIVSVSSPTAAVIAGTPRASGKTAAVIAVMNEIEITGTGRSLTRLEVEYSAKVR